MASPENIGRAWLAGLMRGLAEAPLPPGSHWLLNINGYPETPDMRRRRRGRERLAAPRRWVEPRWSRIVRWLEWQVGR